MFVVSVNSSAEGLSFQTLKRTIRMCLLNPQDSTDACLFPLYYIKYWSLMDSLFSTRRIVSAMRSAIESCFTFSHVPL